jgi:prevent-host-death family protein
MASTTLSSREFNQDTSRATRATMDGPVFITNRGRPAHVLLSISDYHKLQKPVMSLAAALSQPPSPEADFDFDPPRLKNLGLKAAEFD